MRVTRRTAAVLAAVPQPTEVVISLSYEKGDLSGHAAIYRQGVGGEPPVRLSKPKPGSSAAA